MTLQKSFSAMTPLLQVHISSKLNNILFRDMHICGKIIFKLRRKKNTKFRIVANRGKTSRKIKAVYTSSFSGTNNLLILQM